jgi:hypothetical protein
VLDVSWQVGLLQYRVLFGPLLLYSTTANGYMFLRKKKANGYPGHPYVFHDMLMLEGT